MATRTDAGRRRHHLLLTAGVAAPAILLFALLFPREEPIADRPELPLDSALSPKTAQAAISEDSQVAPEPSKSQASSSQALSVSARSSTTATAANEDSNTETAGNTASAEPASSNSIEVASSSIDDAPIVDLLPLPPSWEEHKVKNGDNLSLIFARAGLNAGDVYEFMDKAPKSKELLRIRPGQTLGFQKTTDGELAALRYEKDKLNSIEYHRGSEGFSRETHTRQASVRYQAVSGVIKDSLFLSASAAGLPDGQIMEMANLFGTVMDFVYDVRKGDRFTVLYEELYLDGEKLRNGKILAAEYTNRGETHQAFAYTDQNDKLAYYSAEGVSMQKAFLRAPLDFTRISSNFNPSRLHPIFKTKRPHRGIDYAAARGTPVYAAGDGRVTTSSYSKGAGNYVVIKHGEKYQTKYLHLHKRAVKSGQRVKQRQIIGWVGSTGYATGPHLHYEFLVNGVHRNPRTIVKKLPKAKRLSDGELEQFKAQIASLQIQLRSYAARASALPEQAGEG